MEETFFFLERHPQHGHCPSSRHSTETTAPIISISSPLLRCPHVKSVISQLINVLLVSQGIKTTVWAWTQCCSVTRLFTVGRLFFFPFQLLLNYHRDAIIKFCCHSLLCAGEYCFPNCCNRNESVDVKVGLFSPLCVCHSPVFHLDFTLLDHGTQNNLRSV